VQIAAAQMANQGHQSVSAAHVCPPVGIVYDKNLSVARIVAQHTANPCGLGVDTCDLAFQNTHSATTSKS
jgi:hypothetical protein